MSENVIKRKPIGTPAAVGPTSVPTPAPARSLGASALATLPPKKKGQGKPRNPEGVAHPRRGMSTSVYFSNSDNVDKLGKLKETYPRASGSIILSQLLAAFIKAMEHAENNGGIQN